MRLQRHPNLLPHRGRGNRRAVALVLAAVVLGAGLLGCTSDDPGTPEGGATGTGSQAPPRTPKPIITRTSVVRVDGTLKAADRTLLRSRIRGALDAWIDGAYGGSYPRDDFSTAFDSFTQGAARRAEQDSALLSNTEIGSRIDEVRAVRRQVDLEVLSVAGAAVAVTAKVDLAFDLTGEIARRDVISGELYLTLNESDAGPGDAPGWRIFGYDLQREGA